MQTEDAKIVLKYLGWLESNSVSIKNELEELKDRYNPLRGVTMDGMPGGGMPGDSTGMLAAKLADDGRSKIRERELLAMKADERAIKAALHTLRRDYRTILGFRFVWTEKKQNRWDFVACKVGCSVATAQRKEKAALNVFSATLDTLPDATAIRERAIKYNMRLQI